MNHKLTSANQKDLFQAAKLLLKIKQTATTYPSTNWRYFEKRALEGPSNSALIEMRQTWGWACDHTDGEGRTAEEPVWLSNVLHGFCICCARWSVQPTIDVKAGP